MTLFEITLRLQHECPYNDLTRRNPEAVFALWCNYGIHVLEVSCNDLATFQRIQEDLEQLVRTEGARVLHRAFTGTNVQMVLHSCQCSTPQGQDLSSITDVFERYNCLEMQPTLYSEGWERYRLLAFRQSDVRAAFDALSKFCTVEILSRRTITRNSIRDTFVISTNSLFGGLTDKQSQALLAAFERGYYRVPKKISTEEIAQNLRLPRTTYEEHLRKAETKVLSAIAPYVQLRAPSHA